VRAPVVDPTLTTSKIPYPPPELPAKMHHEMRRCLRPGCQSWPHPMQLWVWEVVQCFRHDEPVPRYEDVMATWHGASTYPHTYLVAVVTNWCRRELNEAVGE
jgi:hypothetical protein